MQPKLEAQGAKVEGTDGESLAVDFSAWLKSDVARNGGSGPAKDPGHRVPFHWPPHPVSHSYHVHPTDWRGKARIEIHGENFDVEVAKTPHGVFGRVEPLWLEARGINRQEMLEEMKAAAEPLFARQLQIALCLSKTRRFDGHLRDLSDLELLKLLYCPNRDVGHEAATLMELRAGAVSFWPAMKLILTDTSHTNRRAAQWAVLDLLEDFGTFCSTPAEEKEAAECIRNLIWNATDDYARAIYKAGVVLGGHLPASVGGPVLLKCLNAPSAIGRRAAIHGLFHVVEWEPSTRDSVVKALRKCAEVEGIPALKDYANRMAGDIANCSNDHVSEPLLDGEG